MPSIFRKLGTLALFLAASLAAFGQCTVPPCINIDKQTQGSVLPMFGTDAGSTNAYVVTTRASLGPGLRDGSLFYFAATNANTGASTLNIDGTGAVAIKKMSGGSFVDLASGDIGAGQVHFYKYLPSIPRYECVTCASGGSSGISGATNHGAMYATAATTGTSTGALTNGQLLIGDTGNPPQASTLTAGSGVSITNGAHSITINAIAPGTCNGSSTAVSEFDAQGTIASTGPTGTQANFGSAVTCGDWMFAAQLSFDGTTDPPVVTDSSGACGNAMGHFTLLGKNSGSSTKLWLYACKATSSVAAGDTVSSTVNCSADCGIVIWQMSGLRDFDNSTNTYFASSATPSLAITPSQTSEVIVSAMGMFHNLSVSTPGAPLTQIFQQGGFGAMNTAWEQVASVSTVTTAWTCCGAFSGTDNIPMVDAAFTVGTSPSSQTIFYQRWQVDGVDQPQEIAGDLISGTGITVSGADDSANHRTKATVALPSQGIGTGSCGGTTHTCVVGYNDTGSITSISNVTISGAGTVPGSVLIEEHTASNSAELDFTTCISGTYDAYRIEAEQLKPASNTVSLKMRMSTDGGATYDSTSSHYAWIVFGFNAAGSGVAGSETGTEIQLVNADIGNGTANRTVSGNWKLSGPASGLFPTVIGQTMYNSASAAKVSSDSNAGYYLSTTAVNAFNILFSSGNITSGTVRCYGLVK